MKFDIDKPWLTLDPWQQKYINTEGNCFLCCGRQSGKTTAMSIKFGERAAKNPNRKILMVAYTEKQAYNLFFKTLMYLETRYPEKICRGRDKPTQHEIMLKNGSQIMCYAAGLKGEGIRTFTVTDLVIDEAAPMAREVFVATMPMLSVTEGTLDISSTPRGKAGFFYECSKRDDFTKFFISAEDCPRHDKEFLAQQREVMTKLEYAQEYLAQFLDELRQFFPDELINRCMTKKRNDFYPRDKNYMGVDVARMGEDESVIISVVKNNDKIIMFDMEIIKKMRLTELAKIIKFLDERNNYKKIYIDTTGMGWGVFDQLLEEDQTKRKVVSVENAQKSLDHADESKKRIFKEDLYNNLLNLMENNKIELFSEAEIALSLKSVQYEYSEGNLKIFGDYTHIAEALVRAAWCSKDKSLNIYYA
jgi:hypothetical protein